MENELNQELLRLVKANNEMLKKIRNTQRRARFFSFIYGFVVIGAALGLFYYLKPFVVKLTEILQTLSNLKIPF